jgi:hypothetical protein
MKLFTEAQVRKFEQIISEAEGRPFTIDREKLARNCTTAKAEETDVRMFDPKDTGLDADGGKLVSFKSAIFPDTQTFPIQDQPARSPRAAVGFIARKHASEHASLVRALPFGLVGFTRVLDTLSRQHCCFLRSTH